MAEGRFELLEDICKRALERAYEKNRYFQSQREYIIDAAGREHDGLCIMSLLIKDPETEGYKVAIVKMSVNGFARKIMEIPVGAAKELVENIKALIEKHIGK